MQRGDCKSGFHDGRFFRRLNRTSEPAPSGKRLAPVKTGVGCKFSGLRHLRSGSEPAGGRFREVCARDPVIILSAVEHPAIIRMDFLPV
jgi:hypothetical protein